MSFDSSESPYPFMALAKKALYTKIDPAQILEILSPLVSHFKFDKDVNQIEIIKRAYDINLNCHCFELKFMRPNIDIPLFSFLDTLNLKAAVFLYIDMDFNFHSIEFEYLFNNRSFIEGGGGSFIENHFKLEINYNNDYKLNTINYVFNNINKSTTVIKDNDMLCPLEDEIQLIELFFQDPAIVQEVIPFWNTQGVFDYNELNIKQSVDLIHMLNI